MKINGKSLLISKKKEHKAIPAFNVSSLELLHAIFETAGEEKSQVIIETSKREFDHLTPEVLHAITEKLSEMHSVDYILHLDRSNDLERMKRALDAGYTSVSAEFAEKDYNKNLELTLEARELTNKYDAALEGVINAVPLVYYKDEMKTDGGITEPEVAGKFAEESKCDSLVISIGNQSGKLKVLGDFRLDLLKKINELLPDLPLVLHGGSFVPDETIKELINNGIAKINVSSELRITYSDRLKKNIAENPEEYTPYRLLAGIKEDLKEVVRTKIKIFNN